MLSGQMTIGPDSMTHWIIEKSQGFTDMGLLRDEPFNIYGGEGGTSFDMLHAIFLRGPLYTNNFFSHLTVSKQFFSGKFLGCVHGIFL